MEKRASVGEAQMMLRGGMQRAQTAESCGGRRNVDADADASGVRMGASKRPKTVGGLSHTRGIERWVRRGRRSRGLGRKTVSRGWRCGS